MAELERDREVFTACFGKPYQPRVRKSGNSADPGNSHFGQQPQ